MGTAGHIDHGKSSLVRVLTGTDPDRLPEERRRGMTIDLGFAAWSLPSGRRAAVVDVPGHRRFVRTVVAGAQGIDVVLLVIAATEGVMPQTREHLAICGHLGVHRAVVALTKSDLVDAETEAVAGAEAEELIAASPLRGAPIVSCSAVTGRGLGELAAAVDAALDGVPERPDRGVPRLWVDRVFTMAGFGPVVTGTLANGPLVAGQEVAVLPAALRARIRGLQRHGESVGRAEPGMRTAVNLSGVDRRSVGRGTAVVSPRTIGATRRFDCAIRADAGAPAGIAHRGHLELHLGTAEVAASVWLLRGAEIRPGSRGHAQLHLAAPVAALAGDHFVLRRAAQGVTVGGGVVLDVIPRRHRRGDVEVERALIRREEGGPEGLVAEVLATQPLGIDRERLTTATAIGPAQLAEVLAALGDEVISAGRWWFSAARWHELEAGVTAVLAEHHRAEPLREGLPAEELATRVRLGRHAGAIIHALRAAGEVVERAGLLALPGHRPATGGREAEALAAGLDLLERRGLDPPGPGELRSAGLTPDLLGLLVRDRRAVRLGDGTILAAASFRAARELVEDHLRAGGPGTVAAIRDRLGATRRVVVPLLERLDADRVTFRSGDVRRLRRSG